MVDVLSYRCDPSGITHPPASSIAGLKLPVFGENSGLKDIPYSVEDKEASTVVVTLGNSVIPPSFTLGAGLSPVPGRLVQKIQAESEKPYVSHHHLLWIWAYSLVVREVPDLISSVQCFGVYAVIVSAKHADWICQLLAYQTMVVCEARRCDGRGWQSNDAMFQQQVAISPSVDWSKMNNSLYSTFLQEQTGRGRTCVHCMETDHASQECALAPVCVTRYHNPRESTSEAVSEDNRPSDNPSVKVCYLPTYLCEV